MKHKRSIISIAMATIMLVSLCVVVSTTSVSATESSRANVETSDPASASVSTSTSSSAVSPSKSSANAQSALVGAPAGIVGSPASCSQGTNTYDLFIRGTDNALWWRHWTSTTGWSAWQSLGGIITSSPGAASSGSGRLTVAARGTDGALWRRFTTDGGTIWAPWISRGGRLLEGTGPAVVSMDTGIKYFVIGTDNALYWSSAASWKSLGGYLTSSPAATSHHLSGIYVGARGGDGAFWEKLTNDAGASWAPWNSYGGRLLAGTGPAVVFTSPFIRLFVIGTNNALYMWHGVDHWISRGGYLTSSPAVCSHTTGTIDVFAVGGDSDIWGRWTTDYGETWDRWYELPA